jgi:Protein of unknown function (DUF3455)
MKIESQIEQAARRFGPAVGSITTTIALLLGGTAALTAHERDDHRAPEVPARLVVPDGNKVHAHGFGVGFQIYTWNGTNWGTAVPEATLFDEDGDFLASHFAGPTWESKDGSKVVGALPPDAAVIVDTNAIPWLRLKALTAEGPGIFDDTTYIQRINTTGGTAPSNPGAFVGQVAREPYTADYFFYRADRVSPTSFFFSTGEPDGKIATLSRPASPGKMQTETADDFVTTNSIVINEATFTGLLSAGASIAHITGVEVEIYHVFPFDSAFPPSGNVPNRTNSPADVEIGSATRDSANYSLRFSARIVNASFTASNSVVNGINKQPGELTHGEGPVTGTEVAIKVHFDPPIALPANHYFFRPEVRVHNGEFLWLSAPRPIVAPGVPFTSGTDLQTWIRNDTLAPDWLRIGTDITGQGPFNAAFSLSGETDTDGDGVADSLDACPDTEPGAVVDANGCSIDQLVPCSGPISGGLWRNHGQYVSSVAHAAETFVHSGLITEAQAEEIVLHAAQSQCGFRAK